MIWELGQGNRRDRGGQITTEKSRNTINKILFLGFIFKPIYSNYLLEHSFQYVVLRNDFSNNFDIFVWSFNWQKGRRRKVTFLPSSDKRTLVVVVWPTGDDKVIPSLSPGSHLIHITRPLHNVLEGSLACDVIDQEDSLWMWRVNKPRLDGSLRTLLC